MTHRAHPIVLSLILAGTAAVTFASTVQANPHALPFTYPYETSVEGALEVEQYVDMTPVRLAREQPDGTVEGVWGLGSVLQTELEYGLTDRLELGWYFQFKQAAALGPSLTFDGIKQRLRLRLAEAGEWPVNVALYLETAELHDELELEEKIILTRRFGALNLLTNLWIEQEYVIPTAEVKHIYNPTAGGYYEITPAFSLGLEYWLRGHFGRKFSEDAKHYLGPTFMVQSERAWLSIGSYFRLDHFSRDAVVDDQYGKVWFRSAIGIDL